MTGNVRLLFATRMLRLFAYGLVSVVLVLYLAAAGLSEERIGLLLALTLAGDAVISVLVTTNADRLGRRRMLVAGAVLMVLAGAVFATTSSFVLLLLAATVGVISPSGHEVGPFLAIEQAALSQEIAAERRVGAFAWYNLLGSFATATGSLAGGGLVHLLGERGLGMLASYRVVVVGYAIFGALLALLFLRLGSGVEPAEAPRVTTRPEWWRPGLGLGPSRARVLQLAGLFTIDSFAGGFVVQAFLAYWFHARFGVQPATLGAIFFGANVLAGLSSLAASWLAKRIGLLTTMVATHLPSNLLLVLVPLMPSLPLAIGVLLLRYSISQMDVPTRQAYTMALVAPDERSAAAGLTGMARTLGASVAPLAAGPLFASASLASIPFFVAGGLKILYDLLVWRTFRKVRLPEER